MASTEKDEQRFAVCLATVDESEETMGRFDAILEIDARAANELRVALREVRRYLQFDLLQLLYLNLCGYEQVVEELRRTASDPLGFARTRSTAETHMILASLFNFCSTLHGLQEHSEARAKRQGGDALAAKVHGLFASAYDSYDELFFARKLRDTLVHSSLEVIDYEVSFLPEEEGGSPVAEPAQVFQCPATDVV